MHTTLMPSYPAPDFETLERVLERLEGVARHFQIDIVDGEYATPLSWPLSDPKKLDALESLQKWQPSYQFEFDLMVADPVNYFESLAPYNPARIVIHIEHNDDVEASISTALQYNWKVDIAILNDTSLQRVVEYLNSYPLLGVQVMGIAAVGKQGQPFDERTLKTVRALRAMYPALDITVDGAVNAHTVGVLYAAGANRLAPGSAITTADDPILAYKQLLSYLA